MDRSGSVGGLALIKARSLCGIPWDMRAASSNREGLPGDGQRFGERNEYSASEI